MCACLHTSSMGSGEGLHDGWALVLVAENALHRGVMSLPHGTMTCMSHLGFSSRWWSPEPSLFPTPMRRGQEYCWATVLPLGVPHLYATATNFATPPKPQTPPPSLRSTHPSQVPQTRQSSILSRFSKQHHHPGSKSQKLDTIFDNSLSPPFHSLH